MEFGVGVGSPKPRNVRLLESGGQKLGGRSRAAEGVSKSEGLAHLMEVEETPE